MGTKIFLVLAFLIVSDVIIGRKKSSTAKPASASFGTKEIRKQNAVSTPAFTIYQ